MVQTLRVAALPARRGDTMSAHTLDGGGIALHLTSIPPGLLSRDPGNPAGIIEMVSPRVSSSPLPEGRGVLSSPLAEAWKARREGRWGRRAASEGRGARGEEERKRSLAPLIGAERLVRSGIAVLYVVAFFL